MLERYQMQVLYAENGREGIRMLENTPDIDVVLMDVMMPEMDGYETTQLDPPERANFKVYRLLH